MHRGRARCDELSQANTRLEAGLDKERAAHGHAVRQYVTEVEARARLQAEGLEERNAKEHALFLQGAAEKRADKAQVRSTVDAGWRDRESCLGRSITVYCCLGSQCTLTILLRCTCGWLVSQTRLLGVHKRPRMD